MPFIHIRSINRDLVTPYPLIDPKVKVMNTLVDGLQYGIQTEMRVLEPGFEGDIVPDYWRKLGNMSKFMVKVAEAGEPESAEVNIFGDYKWIVDELPPNQPIPGVDNPFDASKLPESGTIDENDPILLVSSITLDQQYIRIGGVVVLGTPELVDAVAAKIPVVQE